MLVDRDEYLREFTGEMIKAALDVLSGNPGGFSRGQLTCFSIHRDGELDWLELRFTLDARPGVTFTYEQTIFDVESEPGVNATNAAAIIYGGLFERIAKLPTVPENEVHLIR